MSVAFFPNMLLSLLFLLLLLLLLLLLFILTDSYLYVFTYFLFTDIITK